MRERLRDPEYADGRRWYASIVLCLTLTIIGIDNSILNAALPTLARPTAAGGLGASASELQWIVDVYILVFAGLLLTVGALGDRFGRLRFLNIGLWLFGVGSIVAVIRLSAGVLIGAPAVGWAYGCRADHARDPVVDHQHLHRPSRAGQGDRRLGRSGRYRRRSDRCSAVCSSSTSRGARCSS